MRDVPAIVHEVNDEADPEPVDVSDEEIARRLQIAENRAAAAEDEREEQRDERRR